jgi:hypothetical protein
MSDFRQALSLTLPMCKVCAPFALLGLSPKAAAEGAVKGMGSAPHETRKPA